MASAAKKERYFEGIGRRKTSVARVRVIPSSRESIRVNDSSLDEHFPITELSHTAAESLTKLSLSQKFSVSVYVQGGGIASQSEAVRHGIARALTKFDPELRKVLKKLGYLKRDPRMKERRKFGLKKARRAPQWSKR